MSNSPSVAAPDGHTVTINTGLPPTSPYVIQFGKDGSVFTCTIRFDESTRALTNIRLDRSSAAIGASLTISGTVVGECTPGGTFTISGSTLASFGLDTFEDIGSVSIV